MTLGTERRSSRRRAAGLGGLVVMAAVAAAVLAACGGSSSAATTGGSTNATTGRTAQVLATVRRGNLVDSVAGRLQLSSATSKVNAKAVVQVNGTNAAQVAVGQPVTVVFVKLPAGARRFFGSGSPRPYASAGGAPNPGQSGAPSGGSGYSGGQGFFGGGGGQGGQSAFRGKTAQGTVTAVVAGGNGSVSATVTIAKLPAGVTSKYTGIAQIQVKVLASNVLIIPTAAIKGSGSSATVQLLAGGKTSTQSVVVGQQSAGESEITSGLSAGQNVIYTRRFGFPGGGFRSGQSGGQGFTNGGQPSTTTSGT